MCTVLSAVIYFAIGYHVFHQRNQLRNLSLSNQAKDDEDGNFDSSDVRDSAEKVCYMYSLAYRHSRRVLFSYGWDDIIFTDMDSLSLWVIWPVTLVPQ